MLEPQELEKIKSSLPEKSVSAIQEKLEEKSLSFSDRYIRANLNGEKFNTELIKAIVEVANDHKKATEELKKEVEKL